MDIKKRIEISEEVLAVIFAAVASISEKQLAERPIRRVPQTSTKWSSAGRIESIRRNLNS
jgi:hypothetical protein